MSSLTQSPPILSIDVLSNLDCSLLSESLSLDTVSIASLDSIPPFPLGCMVPLSTYLSVNDSPCNLYKSKLDPLSAATTTIPTPPRLRTLLKENLCVSKWTETLIAADAPGHVPWGEIESKESSIWKPEGSLYSSDAFQETLAKSRKRAPLISTTRLNSANSSARHRNALVFEHEITLQSESGTKRWSVQVPAGSMNPDLVDMVVELRNLNSYFQKEDEEQQENFHFSQEYKPEAPMTSANNGCAHPPSLIVSNSQCVIPVSLESSGSLQTIQKTLAVRRGNRSLPPLTLKPELVDPNTYPNIPTAFLGSPSSYHPTFEFIGDTRSSTELEDMIHALRSQCASIQVQAPSYPALQEEEAPPNSQVLHSRESPLSHPSDEEDEWAFANSLLEKFSDFCVEQCPDVLNVEQKSQELQPEGCSLNPSGGTPSASLHDSLSISPPSPSVASSTSPTLSGGSPRGILKRCKSVRFAESPLVDQIPDDTVSVQAICRSPIRHSIGPATTRALKRPSPLRHTFAPQSAFVSPAQSPSVRIATHQKPSNLAGANAPRLSPPSQSLKRATIVKNRLVQQRKDIIDPSPAKATEETPSLSRSFRNTLVPKGKENKKVRAKPSFSSNRHTMDENALRRAASTTNSTEVQKSRMPVPLRNIFTRFK